jgi:negative regulator of sigma E activity
MVTLLDNIILGLCPREDLNSMSEQKRQQIASLMDSENCSDADLDLLISNSEMRTLWSRFHLVRDVLTNDAPKVVDPHLSNRIYSMILKEPALLIPSARKARKVSWINELPSNIRTWGEQASGFAIAASVTAIMVFGVQTLNTPNPQDATKSAITAIELLEVDDLQITEQQEYSKLQKELLDFTRQSSQYGLQSMTPYVSTVNHKVTVPLTLFKPNYGSILDKSSQDEKTAADAENEVESEK